MVITVILALVAGVGGGVWLKTRLNAQAVAGAVQEQPESKYDVGPPDAQEILELVNKERARIGVAPLVMDENVQKSAQLKADDMEAKGYRQHIIPGTPYTLNSEMAYWVNKSCSKSSENISWRTDNIPGTSQDVFNGWMSSKPHREAIQDPKYTKTGIGTHKDIAVQRFCIP
nr:MAG TPA: hypothetical protein [Caudoviricetes sp.]